MSTLAVVYEKGAVHPVEVAQAMRGIANLVFVASTSAHSQHLRPLMATLGRTVELTVSERADDPSADELSDDPSGALAGAAGHLREAGVDGVVTFSELMIPITAALAARLALPYHDADTTHRLTNKIAQRARLRECGVDETASAPILDPADVERAIDRTGLPAVLKPAHGGGSRKTHRVNSPAELRALLEPGPDNAIGEPMVLEEFLEGIGPRGEVADYVSVESVVVQGQVCHLAVTGKHRLAPPFRETGQFWPPTDDVDAEQVMLLAGKAVAALGITTGLVHTEIKLTRCGPRIIEVNGRLGGHLNELSRRAGGGDLVTLAGQVALGLPVQPRELAVDRVFWQRNTPAPRVEAMLTARDGWHECLKQTGITSYTPYVKPGELLVGGVLTQPLDLICGVADSHQEMADQLRAVGERLHYTFDGPDRAWTCTASQLEHQ